MNITEDALENLIVGLFGNGITSGNITLYDKNDEELTTRDMDEIIDFDPVHVSLLTDKDELVGFALPVSKTPTYYPVPSATGVKDLNVWLFETPETSDFLNEADIVEIPAVDYVINEDNLYSETDFLEPEKVVGEGIDLSRPITIAMASSARRGDGDWNNVQATAGDLIEMLLLHKEGKKDGQCFLQGETAGHKRSSKASIQNYIIGYDLDTGETAEEIDEKLAAIGVAYVRYTTHSHLKDTTEIDRTKFFKWCGMDATKNIDINILKQYLKEKKGFIPRILKNVSVIEEARITDEGTQSIIKHEPMPKHRIVFFLAEPFIFQGKADQNEAINAWKEYYNGFGISLGFIFDRSVTDPARLFYLPRHEKDHPYESKFVDGKYLDLKTYDRVKPSREADKAAPNAFAAAASDLGGDKEGLYVEGYNLKRWIVTRDCDIVSLLEEYYPDAIKSPRTNGPGFHIECPFEDEHSKAGGLGTFGINASDNDKGFHVHCTHDACQGRNKLDYIKKMVENEWFPVSALQDETYCPSIVRNEEIPETEEDEKVDVNQLIEGLNKNTTKDEAIDILRLIGKDTSIDIDEFEEILVKIGRKTKVKKRELLKFIPTRFKNTAEETAKILDESEKVLMAYNERYAMVDTGSKVVIMDFNKKDMSFMNRDDWKALKANEKVLVNVGQESRMECVAKVWCEWSQRRTYEGVVFDPRPNPDKTKMNLFNGFPTTARKGDWSLLKNHIFNILCHADEREFMWLMTWMAHIFQCPWDKKGSAIVVRGPKGAGKSIAFSFLKKLLGKYAMSSANPSHITGNFNWHFRDKLLLIAEEGLFAGSAKDDSVLKDLITGATLTMEPKGIDPFEMENFVRIIIISNEEWVVNATPDERRYYITEASDQQKDNLPYFDAISDQMENGGYEAMMYDLLNFDPFQTFEEGWNILRKPPKTTALAKQVSRSTHSWERFFISLVENMGVSEADSDLEPIELDYEIPTYVKPDDLRLYYYGSLNTTAARYKRTPEAFKELVKKYFPTSKYVIRSAGISQGKWLKLPPAKESIDYIENTLKIKLDIIEFESE